VWTPIRPTGANGGMGAGERPDSVWTPIKSTGANGGMGSPGEQPDAVWTPIRSTGANGGMGSPARGTARFSVDPDKVSFFGGKGHFGS
jgi:hypothetical protein